MFPAPTPVLITTLSVSVVGELNDTLSFVVVILPPVTIPPSAVIFTSPSELIFAPAFTVTSPVAVRVTVPPLRPSGKAAILLTEPVRVILSAIAAKFLPVFTDPRVKVPLPIPFVIPTSNAPVLVSVTVPLKSLPRLIKVIAAPERTGGPAFFLTSIFTLPVPVVIVEPRDCVIPVVEVASVEATMVNWPAAPAFISIVAKSKAFLSRIEILPPPSSFFSATDPRKSFAALSRIIFVPPAFSIVTGPPLLKIIPV